MTFEDMLALVAEPQPELECVGHDGPYVWLRGVIMPEWAYGITGALTLRGVQKTLSEMPEGDRLVLLDSPGGSYNEGLAIAQEIEAYDVRVHVTGRMMSAATLLALRNIEITGGPLSQYLIHYPAVPIMGDFRAHMKAGEELLLVANTLVDEMSTKLKATDAQLRAHMDGNDLLTANQALNLGLISEIVDIELRAPEDPGQTMSVPDDVKEAYASLIGG